MSNRRVNVSRLVDEAFASHQKGELDRAADLYSQVLRERHDHFDALHMLGVIRAQQKRHSEAIHLIEAAVKIKPTSAEALSNYGIALNGLQRHAEAIESYDKALALRPAYADAYNNRGVALTDIERHEEALISFDKALALNPKYAEALNNRGRTLNILKRPEDAVESYRRALVIRPNYLEALNNYANILRALGRFSEALAAYDQALDIKPDYTTALSNRGLALKNLSRHREALACLDAALMIKPDFSEAFNNQGTILQELRRHEEALASYRNAYEINAQYAEAHFNEGLLRLLRGEFDVGWAKYEWRWKRKDSSPVRDFAQPLWLGKEPLDGKTLLLHAEQGLGDTVQFVRYGPLVAARGATVVLEVQPGLKSLLSGFPGISAVLAKGEKLPQFDYHCPLLSLPLAFGTRLNTIPADVPYLTASADRIRKWEERLPSGRLCIGLVWSGSPEHKNDHNRSIGLHKLLPLLETEAMFVSLQREVRAEDQELVRAQRNLLHFGAELTDFTDTAALTSLMDVVISVDTAAAHLAGALAKPLWLLLPFAPDWRWMLDRDDSPWYPTAKLFRQPAIGDWETVVQGVRAELLLLRSHVGQQSTADPAIKNELQSGTLVDAIAMHRQGSLHEAETLYMQILQSNPDHFEARHLLGVIRYQQRQNTEALDLLEGALKLNPNAPEALSNYGLVLHRLQRYNEALASYEKALLIKPDYAECYNNRAVSFTRTKRHDEALASADNALALRPAYPEALNNRGLALTGLNRYEDALLSFQQTLSIRPNYVQALYNYANVLQKLERRTEALRTYDKLLAINPGHAKAFNHRGIILTELNRHEEALSSYNKALATNPTYKEALNNRGNALQKLRRFDEALKAYQEAIKLDLRYVEALNNCGVVLKELKRHKVALEFFDKAAALRPNSAEVLNNRGTALQDLKSYDEALASYDQAIRIRPDFAEALNNRGVVMRMLNRHPEALASYAKALAQKRDFVEALNNRGIALVDLQCFDEALASYHQSQAINPDHAEAHCNEGLLRLLRGEFDVGWAKYEWRWKRKDSSQVRDFAQPLWLGKEPLDGKTLLLHAEQGLGDTVQFVRYGPLVAARGATVVLEVQPGLKSLLSGFPGISAVLAKGEKLPQFDYHCPLLSLPLAFGTRLNTIPADVPYLTASADRIRKWEERLPSGRLCIGLVWSGSPEHKNDHNRSIGLHKLLPLLETEAMFVSLQREVRAEDQELVRAQRNLLHFGAELTDFTDTAALTSLMDVVISVDTAAAHLAGALAKPLWLLLPFAPDWRWMLDRDDSPWYPTAKLFRQPAIGDWETVVIRVKEQFELWRDSAAKTNRKSADRG